MLKLSSRSRPRTVKSHAYIGVHNAYTGVHKKNETNLSATKNGNRSGGRGSSDGTPQALYRALVACHRTIRDLQADSHSLSYLNSVSFFLHTPICSTRHWSVRSTAQRRMSHMGKPSTDTAVRRRTLSYGCLRTVITSLNMT